MRRPHGAHADEQARYPVTLTSHRQDDTSIVARYAEQDLLDVLSAKPDHVELVITGQGASSLIIEQADLVTEIKLY